MERAGFYRTLHGTPPPSDKPRCVVCGDESSGIHYGVNSCEGCKGFFRRCMVKGMQQKCTNNEECEITRFARNSCQFCRLKKCVRVGMSRSASKVGRRPKTTSVLTSDMAVAQQSLVKKMTNRAVGGPRRSQSLMSPSSNPTATSTGLDTGDSLAGSDRNSVCQRTQGSLEFLRTSPFVTPYPTPSHSRASSASGVDSWQEADESNDQTSAQVIDYSLGGNYHGYGFHQRSPAYASNRNGQGGNGVTFGHPSTSGGSLGQRTNLERGWMSPDSSMHPDQTAFSEIVSRKMTVPSREEGGQGAGNYPDSSMDQSQNQLEWVNANMSYPHTLTATSSYYKDFYPNGPQ